MDERLSAEEDSRSKDFSGTGPVGQADHLVGETSDIANGRDAGRDEQMKIVTLEQVNVHVNQAGQHGLPVRLNLNSIGRDAHVGRSADFNDALTANHDGGVFDWRASIAIDERTSKDHSRGGAAIIQSQVIDPVERRLAQP